MKKILITILMLMASMAISATRTETDNLIIEGDFTSSNTTIRGISDFIAGASAPAGNPTSGYVRIYGQTVNGQESLYYMQADGTIYRICRDTVITVYNAEATPLAVGEAVYLTDKMYGTTAHQVKRAKADSATTMPAIGIVTDINGIGTNDTGTIMSFGRTPLTIDTSSFSTSGVSIYVSGTVAGGLTETEPTIPNYSQLVGFVGKQGTNGTITVRTYKPTSVKRPSFIASPTGTNGYVAATSNLVKFTTLVNSYGTSSYSTNTGAWTPPIGACEVGASLRCRNTLAGNRYVRLYLYKNGQYFADLWDYTTAETEAPYMNPIYYWYNDAATNAYTLIFQPETTNNLYGPQNARWWGRLIESN